MLLNPLNAELNPICRLLTLLGAHRILHVSRVRVNLFFSIKCCLFHKLTFVCSNNTFFINHAVKFK